MADHDHDHDLSPLSRREKVRSSFCCFSNLAAAKPRALRNSSHSKGKCSDFISRIGARHHGRRHSTDFRYDALSYSMNFEDDAAGNDDRYDDDSIRRDFVSRLPSTPLSARISSDSSRPRELDAVS